MAVWDKKEKGTLPEPEKSKEATSPIVEQKDKKTLSKEEKLAKAKKEQEEMKARAEEYSKVKTQFKSLEEELKAIKKLVKKDQIKAIKAVCREYGITATNLKGGLKVKKKKKEEEASG